MDKNAEIIVQQVQIKAHKDVNKKVTNVLMIVNKKIVLDITMVAMNAK